MTFVALEIHHNYETIHQMFMYQAAVGQKKGLAYFVFCRLLWPVLLAFLMAYLDVRAREPWAFEIIMCKRD